MKQMNGGTLGKDKRNNTDEVWEGGDTHIFGQEEMPYVLKEY